MNSPRGVSASPKRIKNDNIMPCYEDHNKNKKFKHPKEPKKICAKPKTQKPKEEPNSILGHPGKS